jgi:DNA-directed RNA polymerase subunit RPC12/RpoP
MVDENNGIGDDQVDCIWCYAVHCYDDNDNLLPIVHSNTCAWKKAKAWIIENAGKEQVCEWVKLESGYYHVSCSGEDGIVQEYAEECGYRHCPYCGRKIVVKEKRDDV